MSIDRLKKLLDDAGVVVQEESRKTDWSALFKKRKEALTTSSNVYYVVQVYIGGKPDVKLSGTVVRLVDWLEREQAFNQDLDFVILDYGTDRNWSRSKADEV